MDRRWPRALLLASALGAVTGVLTQSAVVAVLVFCAAFGFLRPQRWSAPYSPPPRALTARSAHSAGEGQGGSRHPHRAQRRPADSADSAYKRGDKTTGTTVICKQVTPERQEWVSSRTGRLYDVLSHNGVMGARPGDRGRVTRSPTGWRIVPEVPAQQEDPPPTVQPGVKR